MIKKTLQLSALAIFILGMGQVHAATPITGEAAAKVFGNITMDIDPGTTEVTIEDINTADDCDNTDQTCMLKGFAWSDVIGWTVFDGDLLEDDIIANAGTFPEEYWAKVNYHGGFGGYAWSEKTGWIQLSSCASIDDSGDCNAEGYCEWAVGPGICELEKSSLPPSDGNQDVDDWGAYADFCPLKLNQADCEQGTEGNVEDADTYCNWDLVESVCVFDVGNNPNGQPIKGFGWSEKLGWIKFGPQSGDVGFGGSFTTWFPDLTPPELEIANPSNTWIPASGPGISIAWDEFASDKDGAGIDLASSFVNVENIRNENPQPPEYDDFEGCTKANQPAALSDHLTVAGAINLDIPQIGELGTAPVHGFCKYELSGVLYNGSGFGFFFGEDGEQEALGLFGTTNAAAIAPHIYSADDIILYVRAGAFSEADSTFTLVEPSAPMVADGSDTYTVQYEPMDDTGLNPIVDIDADLNGTVTATEADWVRNVNMSYRFWDNAGTFTFDTIDPSLSVGISPPLTIAASTYPYGSELDYPNTNPDFTPGFVAHSSGMYLVDATGYAPVGIGNPNRFGIESIDFNTVDEEIPAISPNGSPLDTSSVNNINDNPNPLLARLDYEPALDVTGGSMDSNFLIIGQPATATYSIANQSSNLDLTEYTLDHNLFYTGPEAPLLEIKDINLSNPAIGDAATGRTDPDSSATRYQTYETAGLQGVEANEFHLDFLDRHAPASSFILEDVNGIGFDGGYMVTGDPYVSPEDDCLSNPPCPSVKIDRNDDVSIGSLQSGAPDSNYGFDITPSQIVGQGLTGSAVMFDMTQFLGYNTPGISAAFGVDLFARYNSLYDFPSVEVKSIGLGTTGTVSGGQVFESVGGRDLDTVTTTSSADLRREIRRNSAIITRNIDLSQNGPCDASTNNITLDNSSGYDYSACAVVDNGTQSCTVAFSYGTVDVGDGNGTFSIPWNDVNCTFLFTEGANLNINENITYGAATSNSYGYILLQDSNGDGANVYVDPDVTNVVGLLYAEGSILSSPDGGTTLYYGAGGNSDDLTNQLFWQGSIASVNTIGGAAGRVIPEGADCGPWGNDDIGCAQAHDLDFLRRFAVVNDGGVDFSPAGYLFSGGGQCNPGVAPNPGCAHGALGAGLSTVTIVGDSIDVANSKSLDTFFIERDNRPVPPGFSSAAGLTSSQEIR